MFSPILHYQSRLILHIINKFGAEDLDNNTTGLSGSYLTELF